MKNFQHKLSLILSSCLQLGYNRTLARDHSIIGSIISSNSPKLSSKIPFQGATYGDSRWGEGDNKWKEAEKRGKADF